MPHTRGEPGEVDGRGRHVAYRWWIQRNGERVEVFQGGATIHYDSRNHVHIWLLPLEYEFIGRAGWGILLQVDGVQTIIAHYGTEWLAQQAYEYYHARIFDAVPVG